MNTPQQAVTMFVQHVVVLTIVEKPKHTIILLSESVMTVSIWYCSVLKNVGTVYNSCHTSHTSISTYKSQQYTEIYQGINRFKAKQVSWNVSVLYFCQLKLKLKQFNYITYLYSSGTEEFFLYLGGVQQIQFRAERTGIWGW
jgi:hypothetical protein